MKFDRIVNISSWSIETISGVTRGLSQGEAWLRGRLTVTNNTSKKELEVYHRNACIVISGCLAFTPVPLLLLESLTPSPLDTTLNHQALAFYERALRSPSCRQFPPTTVSLSPSTTQIEEETLLLSPQEKTDLVPIHSPLDTPNFTVTTFIEGCSHSNPDRSDTAADFLRNLPTTDVVVWTDSSVPAPVAPEVQVSVRSAEDAHVPPHCPTQLALSPLASQLSLLH